MIRSKTGAGGERKNEEAVAGLDAMEEDKADVLVNYMYDLDPVVPYLCLSHYV